MSSFAAEEATRTNTGSKVPAEANIISISLQTSQPYRKVYARLALVPTDPGIGPVANYYAKLSLVFWRNDSIVGSLPLGGGAGSIQETLPTIFVTGGNVVPDSMGLYQSDGTATIIHPHYCHTAADKVTVSIDRVVGCQQLYVWLGVVSSEQR
jgi:hypothetical protein